MKTILYSTELKGVEDEESLFAGIKEGYSMMLSSPTECQKEMHV